MDESLHKDLYSDNIHGYLVLIRIKLLIIFKILNIILSRGMLYIDKCSREWGIYVNNNDYERELVALSEDFIRHIQELYNLGQISTKEYEEMIRNKIRFLNQCCVYK